MNELKSSLHPLSLTLMEGRLQRDHFSGLIISALCFYFPFSENLFIVLTLPKQGQKHQRTYNLITCSYIFVLGNTLMLPEDNNCLTKIPEDKSCVSFMVCVGGPVIEKIAYLFKSIMFQYKISKFVSYYFNATITLLFNHSIH